MRYLITVSINSLRRLLARNQCSHRYVRSRRFANTPSGNTLIAFDDRYLENGKTSTNIILLDLCIIFLPKSGGLNYYPLFRPAFIFIYQLKKMPLRFPSSISKNHCRIIYSLYDVWGRRPRDGQNRNVTWLNYVNLEIPCVLLFFEIKLEALSCSCNIIKSYNEQMRK